MSGLPDASFNAMGSLTINPSGAATGAVETELLCPAWWVLDLSPLWGFPELRGENVVVPGADGRRTYRQRVDETVVSLPMVIIGDVDQDGDAYTDVYDGLYTNLAWLRENVHNPPPTGATRGAELALPDGSTVTASVQCRIALGTQTDSTIRAVLDMTIPAGSFA